MGICREEVSRETRCRWSLRVLIAVPLGRTGKGGIDRLVEELRTEFDGRQQAGCLVESGTTRRPGRIWLSPVYLGLFSRRMLLSEGAWPDSILEGAKRLPRHRCGWQGTRTKPELRALNLVREHGMAATPEIPKVHFCWDFENAQGRDDISSSGVTRPAP